MSEFAFVTFTKEGGTLTKRITLTEDGQLHPDGSECRMSKGTAERTVIQSINDFAEYIDSLTSSQAIALGRFDIPSDKVNVVTQNALNKAKQTGRPPADTIARTGAYIGYAAGKPAIMLLDHDTKGMSDAVAKRIKAAGDWGLSVAQVMPEIKGASIALRKSTSSGISRKDTGEPIPGSDGAHLYIAVKDGSDIERALQVLHDRLWLAGYGWMMLGKAGQILERSIIDRSVGAPERLVFEGPPDLDPRLMQNRKAVSRAGFLLDTCVVLPPLTIPEKAKLEQMKAAAKQLLAPERATVKDAYVKAEAEKLRKKNPKLATFEALRVVERRCEGILRPSDILIMDEGDPVTVRDILADPEKYVAATLADPQEGIEYGRCKAMIMRCEDGTLWIHSFAHGRIFYEIKRDFASVEAEIAKASKEEADYVFVRGVLEADLRENEVERLRNQASEKSSTNRRTLDNMLKSERKEQKAKEAKQERERRKAERNDPRPLQRVPDGNSEFSPVMDKLNQVLGAAEAPEPPMRDLDGYLVKVHNRPTIGLHKLTSEGANGAEDTDKRLPPPEQLSIVRLSPEMAAEEIERYIAFENEDERLVHLPSHFVTHYMQRSDGVLPAVYGTITLPMVTAKGMVISGSGLDRERGIVRRIPYEITELVPQQKDCTEAAIMAAGQRLKDEWLIDVATDAKGKWQLIAICLQIIEYQMLRERPGWLITAGTRGTGKTTAISMITEGVLGVAAPAATWAPDSTERRKALLPYLAAGLPVVVWDNIPEGEVINCPHVNKALTSPEYADRELGRSEFKVVPANTVQLWTGNNISRAGDAMSRIGEVRLSCDEEQPENREFKNQDPIAWTQRHRAQILRDLYTVLLGNPRLRMAKPPAVGTRFKDWMHLCGTAVEYAAKLCGDELDFKQMFIESEGTNEASEPLRVIFRYIFQIWPYEGVKASEIVEHVSAHQDQTVEFMAALRSVSDTHPKAEMSAIAIALQLRKLRDIPVKVDHDVLKLTYKPHHKGGTFLVVSRANPVEVKKSKESDPELSWELWTGNSREE